MKAPQSTDPITKDDVNVSQHILEQNGLKVNAMSFIPTGDLQKDVSAVFTHGYTSSKHSILSWAFKLSEFGIPVTLFDLPGHFIGSFHEVDSFENFQVNSPSLFLQALEEQNKLLKQVKSKIIFGGHSLGALLSLKVPEIESNKNIYHILVGFGLNKDVKTHFFDTPFFRKTMNARQQMISSKLHPDKVFSWIKNQKTELKVQNKNITLIAGEDDVVIGKSGMENLKNHLEVDNEVIMIKPKRLPHHQPDLASSYILQHIKEHIL